jgi:hypothetical protein
MLDKFKRTPERIAVMAELDQAQAHLVRAARMLTPMKLRERAHKTLNIAQRVSNKKSLLALDWHDEDARQAA